MDKIRCECGWIGRMRDLIVTPEDPDHKTHCPMCKSEEVFSDEVFFEDEWAEE